MAAGPEAGSGIMEPLPEALKSEPPTGAAPSGPEGAGSTRASAATWTVMLYMAADNSKEQGALDAIDEIESALMENTDHNVLVQLDRIAGYSNADGDWSGTRRYALAHDEQSGTIGTTQESNLGELNMASAVVLTDFLKWGINNYPAERYMVILWGHGYGTEGALKDDTSGGAVMDLRTMSGAADQAARHLGRPLDVWAFDADYMGMFEAAYSIKASADVMFAYQDNILRSSGMINYTSLPIVLDVSATGVKAGQYLVVDAFVRWGEEGAAGTFSAGAWHLGSLDGQLAESVNNLAQKLNHAAGALAAMLRDPLGTAREAGHVGTHPDVIDLMPFIISLMSDTFPIGDIFTELTDACYSAYTAMWESSIMKIYATGPGEYEMNGGIDILLPASDLWPAYSLLDSSIETAWDEFILEFITPPVPTVRVNEEPTADLQTPFDGEYLTGTVRVEGRAYDTPSLPMTSFGVDEVQVKLGRGPWQTAVGRNQWWADIDTRQVTNGLHRLAVRSYDGVDYSENYTAIDVAVGNPGKNAPPEVLIETPGPDERVSGMVDIEGFASDDAGVETVEVRIGNWNEWEMASVEPVEMDGDEGGGRAGTGTARDEEDMTDVQWSYRWDTSSYNNGQWTIEVRAFDGEMYSLRDSAEVRLINPWGNQPPRAVITSPEEDGLYRTDRSVLFDGSDSWDPDDDALTFQWFSNTTGALEDEEVFYAQLAEGKHLISLMVSDGTFESTDSVNVTVTKSNTTTFLVWNYYYNTFDEVEASLTESGESVQVWVDVRTSTNAREYHQQFSEVILPAENSLFGNQTDKDGDGDIWLLITDIQGNVAGYYMPSDPNGRDLLYLDESAGISVAAHELNHMIHNNYDPQEYGWISEGEAQFAEVYIYGEPRVNTHMGYYESRTDTQLDWRHYAENQYEVLAQYGVGFLFTFYFAEKFGGDPSAGVLLRDGQSFIPAENTHLQSRDGVQHVIDILEYDAEFDEVFQNWAVANIVDNTSYGGGEYGYAGLDVRVDLTGQHDTYPASFNGDLNPWAAEYHSFTAGVGTMRLELFGDTMADYSAYVVGYAAGIGGPIKFIHEMELDLNAYGKYDVENMTMDVGELCVIVMSGDAGEVTDYTLRASMLGDNQPPTAEAGPDVSVNAGEYVHFDGSASHDPDGDPLEYFWDFDASDGIGEDATGATPVHAYLEEGTYTVTLNVTDNRGLSAVDDLTVTVRVNLPPVAVAGDDVEADLDELVRFDGTASSDPDGDPMEFLWDLDGDGVWDAEEAQATWRYSEEGTYVVTLSVGDRWGGNSTDTLNVTVFHNEAPVAVAGEDIEVNLGGPARFDGGASTDPDGDLLNYGWDFDGSDGIDPELPDSSGKTANYVYSSGGTYLVTLTVTDPYGSSASDTLTVSVNTAPQAKFFWTSDRTYESDIWDFIYDFEPDDGATGDGVHPIPPDDFDEGIVYTEEPVHFNGGGSYDADGDALGYLWAAGGLVDTGGPMVGNEEFEVTFDEPGDYEVVLFVDDLRGGNETYMEKIRVFERPVPPVPDIRYPGNGDELSGVVEVSGRCDDEDRVEAVEVKIDGSAWNDAEPDGDDLAKWTYEWDTTRVKEGLHTITVRSIADGEPSEEEEVEVRVVPAQEGEDGEDGDSGGDDESPYERAPETEEGDSGNLWDRLKEEYYGVALWIWGALALVLLITIGAGAAYASASGKRKAAKRRRARKGRPGPKGRPRAAPAPSSTLAPGKGGGKGTAGALPKPKFKVAIGKAGGPAGVTADGAGGEKGGEDEEEEEEFEEVEAVEPEGGEGAKTGPSEFIDQPDDDLKELIGDSEIFQVVCPGCKHKFPVIRGQTTATCPKCGVGGEI